MIMEAGIDDLTSSDSIEEEEYSEATTAKLEDLAGPTCAIPLLVYTLVRSHASNAT